MMTAGRVARLLVCVVAMSIVVAGCARPPRVAPSDAPNVAIRAIAGPVCPVERPDDPACEPRPVVGAVMVVLDGDGDEVTRVTTGQDGSVMIHLTPGRYLIQPQPVVGLMGTASPVDIDLADAEGTSIELAYDTGIR